MPRTPSLRRQRLLQLFLLPCALVAGGCATEVAAPEGEVEARQVFQRIANALPRASFGWGETSGLVEMAASTRAEGPRPQPPELKATEDGFRLVVDVYRPRGIWVPYQAIRSARYEWKVFPNALVVPFVVIPWQVVRATIVLDRGAIQGFDQALERDAKRLEAISRETGLGGPWSHAQNVRGKVLDDEDEFGPGSLAIYFDYSEPMLPWIPIGGRAEDLAGDFAWAAAHPGVELPPREEEAPAEGAPAEGAGEASSRGE